MAGLNKVTLIGNLGRDPEVRYSQGGTAVCNLSLAVTERRKDGDTYKDHTEWFRVVVFGKTAENAGKYLKKGRQVFVEGRLQSNNWQDKEGNKRTSTEVIANQMLFLSNGQNTQDSSSFTPPPAAASPQSTGRSDDAGYLEEDDIPF